MLDRLGDLRHYAQLCLLALPQLAFDGGAREAAAETLELGMDLPAIR
jgi:hypothetical protein